MSKGWTFAIGSIVGGVQVAVWQALSDKPAWLALSASIITYQILYAVFVYFDKKA